MFSRGIYVCNLLSTYISASVPFARALVKLIKIVAAVLQSRDKCLAESEPFGFLLTTHILIFKM